MNQSFYKSLADTKPANLCSSKRVSIIDVGRTSQKFSELYQENTKLKNKDISAAINPFDAK